MPQDYHTDLITIFYDIIPFFSLPVITYTLTHPSIKLILHKLCKSSAMQYSIFLLILFFLQPLLKTKRHVKNPKIDA